MKLFATKLQGCVYWSPEVRGDNRGYFYRGFCKNELKGVGMEIGEIVQVNHSFSAAKGTFRGLHFQRPPYAEEKIITCLEGEVLDIIVDIRKGSPTFLNYVTVNLSAENRNTVMVPKGCAHGFITLARNTRLMYMHTAYYMPDHEGGISIRDPKLKIELPTEIAEQSERDKGHPHIGEYFDGIEL